MKIIQLIYALGPGGAEKFVVNLSNELANAGHDVTVCILRTDQIPLRTYLKKELAPNIKFVGFRSDVERIISASRITLLLTNNQVHAEGIPNSIMESMAAGIPVIASEGGGTSEIISNGNDGYIIQPQDHFTASNHIINLLNDPNLYNRMSNAAKEKIKTKFLLKDMANKYINLYKSLTE